MKSKKIKKKILKKKLSKGVTIHISFDTLKDLVHEVSKDAVLLGMRELSQVMIFNKNEEIKNISNTSSSKENADCQNHEKSQED